MLLDYSSAVISLLISVIIPIGSFVVYPNNFIETVILTTLVNVVGICEYYICLELGYFGMLVGMHTNKHIRTIIIVNILLIITTEFLLVYMLAFLTLPNIVYIIYFITAIIYVTLFSILVRRYTIIKIEIDSKNITKNVQLT